MHVMMVHGRHAAAAAADAHKLRRRDVFKLVVRHITGGFTAPGGGKRRETRLWELDGPVCVLKYPRGDQVREGVRGCDAHDATTTKVIVVIEVLLFMRNLYLGDTQNAGMRFLAGELPR